MQWLDLTRYGFRLLLRKDGEVNQFILVKDETLDSSAMSTSVEDALTDAGFVAVAEGFEAPMSYHSGDCLANLPGSSRITVEPEEIDYQKEKVKNNAVRQERPEHTAGALREESVGSSERVQQASVPEPGGDQLVDSNRQQHGPGNPEPGAGPGSSPEGKASSSDQGRRAAELSGTGEPGNLVTELSGGGDSATDHSGDAGTGGPRDDLGHPLPEKPNYEASAEELRASVSREDVAAIIAEYGPAEEIGPRGNNKNSSGYLPDKLSTKSDKAIKQLQKKVEEARVELARRIERHDDIRRNGLDAISDFDIRTATSGRPLVALKTSLELTHNHVSYCREVIRVCESLLADLQLDTKGFSLEAIDGGGFTLVDGNLRVKVEPTEPGKFQASWMSATSSPHCDKQTAIDWAANLREEAKQRETVEQTVSETVDLPRTTPTAEEYQQVLDLVRAGEQPFEFHREGEHSILSRDGLVYVDSPERLNRQLVLKALEAGIKQAKNTETVYVPRESLVEAAIKEEKEVAPEIQDDYPEMFVDTSKIDGIPDELLPMVEKALEWQGARINAERYFKKKGEDRKVYEIASTSGKSYQNDFLIKEFGCTRDLAHQVGNLITKRNLQPDLNGRPEDFAGEEWAKFYLQDKQAVEGDFQPEIRQISKETHKNWLSSGDNLGRENGWDLVFDDRFNRYLLLTPYNAVDTFPTEESARRWAKSNKATRRGYFTEEADSSATNSPVEDPESHYRRILNAAVKEKTDLDEKSLDVVMALADAEGVLDGFRDWLSNGPIDMLFIPKVMDWQPKPAEKSEAVSTSSALWGAKVGLNLLKASTGVFSFVGTVPSELMYVEVETGQTPSAEVLKEIQQSSNPAMLAKSRGVKTRSFQTAEEAIAAAEQLGYEVVNKDQFAAPAKKERWEMTFEELKAIWALPENDLADLRAEAPAEKIAHVVKRIAGQGVEQYVVFDDNNKILFTSSRGITNISSRIARRGLYWSHRSTYLQVPSDWTISTEDLLQRHTEVCLKTIRGAHQEAIAEAIKEGKEIPEEVLAEYAVYQLDAEPEAGKQPAKLSKKDPANRPSQIAQAISMDGSCVLSDKSYVTHMTGWLKEEKEAYTFATLFTPDGRVYTEDAKSMQGVHTEEAVLALCEKYIDGKLTVEDLAAGRLQLAEHAARVSRDFDYDLVREGNEKDFLQALAAAQPIKEGSPIRTFQFAEQPFWATLEGGDLNVRYGEHRPNAEHWPVLYWINHDQLNEMNFDEQIQAEAKSDDAPLVVGDVITLDGRNFSINELPYSYEDTVRLADLTPSRVPILRAASIEKVEAAVGRPLMRKDAADQKKQKGSTKQPYEMSEDEWAIEYSNARTASKSDQRSMQAGIDRMQFLRMDLPDKWDAEVGLQIRPSHEDIITHALETGVLTQERAEELGHFEAYPNLKAAPEQVEEVAAGDLESDGEIVVYRKLHGEHLRRMWGDRHPKEMTLEELEDAVEAGEFTLWESLDKQYEGERYTEETREEGKGKKKKIVKETIKNVRWKYLVESAWERAHQGPERIFEVRGVKVRIDHDGAAHAVAPGYFPVSSTGYRSIFYRRIPEDDQQILVELEKQAVDQDKAWEQALRWSKQGNKDFKQGKDIVGHFISLDGAFAAVMGCVLFAPEEVRAKALELALELAQKLENMPDWSEGAPPQGGAWNEEIYKGKCAGLKGVIAVVERVKKGDSLALADLPATQFVAGLHSYKEILAQQKIEAILKLAAESPAELRFSDIDRVLQAADDEGLQQEMKNWIASFTPEPRILDAVIRWESEYPEIDPDDDNTPDPGSDDDQDDLEASEGESEYAEAGVRMSAEGLEAGLAKGAWQTPFEEWMGYMRTQYPNGERLDDLQAMRELHRSSVELSLTSKVVDGPKIPPAEVLADYPDLQAKAEEIQRKQAEQPDTDMKLPVVDALPEGWTEGTPGGMATNTDPLVGGIIDSEIASGKWFVIPENDIIGKLEGFETRSEASKAFQAALAAKQAADANPDKESWQMTRDESLEQESKKSSLNPNHYRITDEITRTTGFSPKARYEENVAAIKLLKQIEEEGREATEGEKVILVKYNGWGGLAKAFEHITFTDRRENPWLDEARTEMKALLTDAEYEAARASVNNAHFTSPEVVRAIWDAVERMGYKGGRFVESSMGIGNILGLTPEKFVGNTQIVGTELDDLTGRMAKLIYPDADIRIQGFEEAKIPKGFFNLAITNVPFGEYRVHDPEYNEHKLNIHDHFICKNLDKLKPGGIGAFVTSAFTMDKLSTKARRMMAEKAELVGAIRLPENALEAQAGVKVTTDILFFRKRIKALGLGEVPEWISTVEKEMEAEWSWKPHQMQLNSYFENQPENMLGEYVLSRGQYGATRAVVTENTPLAEALPAAVERIIGEPPAIVEEVVPDLDLDVSLDDEEEVGEVIANFGEKSEGTFLLHEDGKVYQVTDDGAKAVEVELSGIRLKRMLGLIEIRDAMGQVFLDQKNHPEDTPEVKDILAKSRYQMNVVYDKFYKKFGPVNTPVNRRLFAEDPECGRLMALELYDPEHKTAEKADVFFQRVLVASKPVTAVDTPHEALLVCLDRFGEVNLNIMADLCCQGVDDVEMSLLESKAIFLNPTNEVYITASSYLSGNVRQKLAEAQAAAEIDEKYQENVKALEEVQPKDLTPKDIDVRLGSPWIPADDIKAFVREVLDIAHHQMKDVSILYRPLTGQWMVDIPKHLRTAIKSVTEYGTGRRPFDDLLTRALNQQSVTVYDIIDLGAGHTDRVLNTQETVQAQQKLDELQQKFQKFIFEADEKRANRLVTLYNEKFNCNVPPKYDGSYLTFPGMSATMQPRPHQANAVARFLQTGQMLAAHEVGTGKTISKIAGAIEAKRLGKTNKPMICIPNHMLEQFEREARQLYPSAKILAVGKKDMAAANRKKFTGRVANNNWDLVIMTHSMMEKVGIPVEFEAQLIEQELLDYRVELEGIDAEDRGDRRRYGVKQIEQKIKKLKSRLKDLLDGKKKDLITLEDMGVDSLMIDESHNFKNLAVETASNSEVSQNIQGSARAWDLYMKTRWIYHNRGEETGLWFSSATPVSNNVLEILNIQRYLQPSLLREMGVYTPTAWAGTFLYPKSQWEPSPSGSGWRVRTRYGLQNIPELMQSLRVVMDVVTAEETGIKRPEAETVNTTSGMSNVQKVYMKYLDDRVKRIQAGGVDPSDDNLLKIVSEGRKLALDPRLLIPELPDYKGSKVHQCADDIFEEWQNSEKIRGTQLLFIDMGTPKKNGSFSVYEDLKQKLIERGIPPEEIAFIHDYASDDAKADLFKKVRSGEIRVLIGSTAKMGEGTNVQERAVSVGHLDAPWRPSDIEQRDGRVVRQGNVNDDVRRRIYTTEDSFDLFMWNTLKVKAETFSRVIRGDVTVRRLDMEVDPTYAETAAITSNDGLIKEKLEVDQEVSRLEMLFNGHLDNVWCAKRMVRSYEEEIADSEEVIEKSLALPKPNDDKEWTLDLAEYGFEKPFKGNREKLLPVLAKVMNTQKISKVEGLQYRGLEVIVTRSNDTQKGKNITYWRVGGEDSGFVRQGCARLEDLIDSFETHLQHAEDQKEFYQNKLEVARETAVQAFKYDEQLRAAQARQREIMQQIEEETAAEEDENGKKQVEDLLDFESLREALFEAARMDAEEHGVEFELEELVEAKNEDDLLAALR